MISSLYIHIPFCLQKCDYCDFFSKPHSGKIPDAYVEAILAEDLSIIVNQLFAAGAEAISINGNRIISTTAIVDIGYFIKVNSKRIPDNTYVINAIGNPDYLRSAVLGKGGHVDELKELGHETSVKENKNILIDKYDGEMSTKYID